MKKNHFFLMLGAVLITAFVVASRSFVGHWRVAYANNMKGHVLFRKDGTAEATFDGQTWKVGGPYKVEGNTMSMADSTCGLTYWASYKADWFSDDSMRMVIVEDTCTGRKESINGAVLVREK